MTAFSFEGEVERVQGTARSAMVEISSTFMSALAENEDGPLAGADSQITLRSRMPGTFHGLEPGQKVRIYVEPLDDDGAAFGEVEFVPK